MTTPLLSAATRLACLALSCACLLAAPGALARTDDADAWLARAYSAAHDANYRGILIVADDTGVASSRVAHMVAGSERIERIDWLDGQARTVLRQRDRVVSLWPRSKIALIEPDAARNTFPALLSRGDATLLRWYELRALGAGRVAGHEADVVLLRARDALRHSQRLWVDRRSGLLLRAEMLGPVNQVLMASAFTELVLEPQPQLARLDINRMLTGYRVLRPQVAHADLASHGWRIEPPAGFREVRCALRMINPLDTGGAEMVQAIYSDGLAHVSLFIEPFDRDRHQTQGLVAAGATQALAQRRGAQWITLVGEVPTATLQRFADGLTALAPASSR